MKIKVAADNAAGAAFAVAEVGGDGEFGFAASFISRRPRSSRR